MPTLSSITQDIHVAELIDVLNANFAALNDAIAGLAAGGGGGGGGGAMFQFSQLGTGAWHYIPTAYDAFLRYSSDGGATWSVAIRFVGESSVAATVATLAYAATIDVNLAASRIFKLTPAGNVAWTISGVADGLECLVRVMPQENTTLFTFPAEWVFMGEPPLSLPAGKWGTLYLHGCGPNATDVLAAWDQQK